jgi:hypothetical protein
MYGLTSDGMLCHYKMYLKSRIPTQKCIACKYCGSSSGNVTITVSRRFLYCYVLCRHNLNIFLLGIVELCLFSHIFFICEY